MTHIKVKSVRVCLNSFYYSTRLVAIPQYVTNYFRHLFVIFLLDFYFFRNSAHVCCGAAMLSHTQTHYAAIILLIFNLRGCFRGQ